MADFDQADPSALERNLKEISTPGHSNYGRHLDVEQASQLLRPSHEASQTVMRWLKASGIKQHEIEKRGEWVNFPATLEQASAMMNTDFMVYRHLGKRDTDSIRTTKVELPRSVLRHIKMIHPTTRFDMMTEQSSTITRVENIDDQETLDAINRMVIDEPSVASCDKNRFITPKCLMELYKIGGVTVYPDKAGRIGVAGFLEQSPRFGDLAKFVNQAAQWAGNANFTYELINGEFWEVWIP
jgi:tripeptidyl-peptidase I